jgi:ABC-type multidrug transport system fused ATPase/permease subunit
MAAIFVACVLAWILHGPGRVIERFVAIRIRERYADSLFAKAVRLPLAWHERNHSGETIQRVEKAGSALFGFSQHQFVYLQNAVNLAGPIVAIFVLSLPTGLAAVLGYLLIAVVLVRFDRIMVQLNRAQNQAERRYSAALVDCLGNIATVLTLRLDGAARRLVGERLTAVFEPLRGSIVWNEAKWCAIDLLNNALRCGLVVVYGWLAWRHTGTVLLGNAVMVYQYAQQAGGVVSNMAGNYQDLVRFQTDLATADPLEAAADEIPSVPPPPAQWREIAVSGLHFTYVGPRGAAAALEDVSLRLARGRRIALVGESGSGKSTLLRVLAGLYPAERAAFTVDGRPQPALAHLGPIATLVPQDPEIFAGTIGHNVTLGVDYGEAELLRACDIACFTPVLAQLPRGLDTDIAERGLNLSGGQKQRLALARGILAARGSSLLMLDEPTSSLDPQTEARVYDRLLAAFPGACIVSSIHRLHLLSRFDEVVLMAEGRVVATGTVAELRQREPRFRMLWERYAGAAAA